jgi:hypothetical protein
LFYFTKHNQRCNQHKDKTLKTDFEKGGGIIELINTDSNSAVYALKFDFNNMKFYAYDWNYQELSHGEILPTVNKKWWSRDPKADEFPDKGPYIFVSCNPINRIDPTGEADYYNNNGTYLGSDGINDDRTMTASGYQISKNKDGKEIKTFTDPVDLNISHQKFMTISNIIKKEGITKDPREYICIAHASNNRAKESKTNQYNLLLTGYSSVPKKEKISLSPTDNSTTSNLARAAEIDVLLGNPDPTCGASFWDGTDFLAWGLHSPDGTPQNKFEEYKYIIITTDIYEKYLGNNLSYYKSGNVKYYGKTYSIPADVFTENSQYGCFIYETAVKKATYSIIATVAAGRSIFWRREKSR